MEADPPRGGRQDDLTNLGDLGQPLSPQGEKIRAWCEQHAVELCFTLQLVGQPNRVPVRSAPRVRAQQLGPSEPSRRGDQDPRPPPTPSTPASSRRLLASPTMPRPRCANLYGQSTSSVERPNGGAAGGRRRGGPPEGVRRGVQQGWRASR